MAYYVGAISTNNRWVGIDVQAPSVLTNIFSVDNKGTGLVFNITQYFRASYELPQGSILARVYINDRLVVEDVPVLDRVMVSYPNTHGWIVNYDIGSSDLDKLSGGQPLRIEVIRFAFYVNEEGLRGVEIEQRNRTNAFDFFKQEVQTDAFSATSNSFVYAKGLRHDFTTSAPYDDYFYTTIDGKGYGQDSMRGFRMVITPLIDPKTFALTRLFRMDIYNATFDQAGTPRKEETPTPTYSFTLSGMQLSVSYVNDFQKQEQAIGPVSYGQANTYMAQSAVIDDLPATTYANHEISMDPNGAKGFYFLDPTEGRVGFSADLLVKQMVLQLSLSAYFSITRDVATELLVEAHSDLSVADALLV